MFSCARNGKLVALARAIKSTEDLDALDGAGLSALHHAAAGGHERAVKLLLDAGADSEVKDSSQKRTPLHFAASMAMTGVCELLIARGADAEAVEAGASGGTPLLLALFYGASETADAIAQHSTAPDNLRVAAGLGRVDALDALWSDGALRPQARAGREWYRPHDELPEWSATDIDQEVLDEARQLLGFSGHGGADVPPSTSGAADSQAAVPLA